MQNYTFRLKPGQDLFESIEAFAMEKQVEAGCIIYTTAEIVLAAFDQVIYKREFAEDSGYKAVVVAR